MDELVAGRYRLEGPLGTGGSSQVFRAYDEIERRPVAVKILDRGSAMDAALRDAFVRDARSLAGLSHPNLVRIFGDGDVNGVPYIVMELVEGPSLAERLGRGPLSLGDAVRIATQVAAALVAAHAHGVVHGDLAPANVLLTQDDTVKLTDFGLARPAAGSGDEARVFATARYIAPERVMGQAATPATDVYGLGLLLYEMLLGRPPFEGEQASVLLQDHLLRAPVPPSHLRPSLPRIADEIVLRALAKRPEHRYRRMADLAAAIERLGLSATRLVTVPRTAPAAATSPLLDALSRHGAPLRRLFFGVLAALPLGALVALAGAGEVGAVTGAALIVALALAGQLGPALALAWVVETAIVFLFVPGLAVLFAVVGLVAWLRDADPERAAFALAFPLAAPFGLAPALVLAAPALFGLGGVVVTAVGGMLAALAGIAVGRPGYGPFALTGLPLDRDSLFDPGDAAGTEAAFAAVLRGSTDRFGPLADRLQLRDLAAQVTDLVSRVAGADVALVATVLAWAGASFLAWAVVRGTRLVLVRLARGQATWFALHVVAGAAGALAGAAALAAAFIAWPPLAEASGRSPAPLLLASAAGGAAIALAIGVVVGATSRDDADDASGFGPLR